MIKKISLIFTGLILICFNANAQNLFPNPDFEEYNECPTSYSGINKNECKDWFCIAGSPDYYNCSFYDYPSNTAPYGVPSSGNGVVGMWGLINNLSCNGELQRESIYATLTKPLQKCKKYEISFDISLALTGSASTQGFGHDCLDFGFYFYKGSNPNACSNPPCGCWGVQPQISVSAKIIPFKDYITFTFEFVPEDDYTKVAIGPFCNENMNLPECYAPPENFGPFTLYFNLDNLILKQSETYDQIIVSENEICPNDSIVLYENHIDSAFNWQWNVEGAIKNSSDGQFTSFIFPTAGYYSVELITQRNCGNDTTYFDNFILVHPNYQSLEMDTLLTICSNEELFVTENNPDLFYFWSDKTIGAKRKFKNSGNYTLYVIDNFGCHNDSSTIQIELIEDLLIFPNPTKQAWKLKNKLPVPNNIVLFDTFGRTVYTDENVKFLELDSEKISFSPGIYYLSIYTQNCNIIKKLIYLR